MIRHLFSMQEEEKAAKVDNVPLKDYVSRFTSDPQAHLFVNLFCCFFLGVPYERASAGEFGYCFAHALADASWGYPEGGFQEISNSFLRAARRDGAVVRLGEGARRILVKNNRAWGVETDKGVYEAEIVVSNAGLRKTVELAGRENFPAEYAERVFTLTDSFTGITVKFALREKFLDDPFVLYTPGPEQASSFLGNLAGGRCPSEVALFVPVPSNLDSRLAPPGKQLVIAGTMGPPLLSMSKVAAAELDLVEATVKRLFPGIEDRIEWSLRTDLATVNGLSGRDSADVVGIAQTYDQCGRMRPRSALPIANLYQVGSDAGGKGVGTELAVDSALRLADLLTGAV
jgi:phytoene dehydrogenase-like protein